VPAVWAVEGFGVGKGSGGGSAPIHFGDTEKREQKEEAAVSNNGAKSAGKKPAKPAKKAVARKAGRESWLLMEGPKSPFSMPSNRRCLKRWSAIQPLSCSAKMLAFTVARSRRAKACLRNSAGSA